MKKIIILAAALLLSVSAFAQNAMGIYNKYSDRNDVSAVYISSAMFRMMGRIPDLDIDANGTRKDLSPIIKSLKGMYMISSENARTSEDIRKDVDRYVRDGHFEMMMEVKDHGEIVRIFTVTKGEYVTSFTILANEGPECTFISFEGQILAEDLERMLAD